MMEREILAATRNKGKLSELREFFETEGFRLRSLDEFPHVTTVAETGETFAENATLKARGYAAQTGVLTLADDSGLEVDALEGAPGVFSARYGGENLDDAARRELLLEAMRDAPDERRTARFICVLALADPQTDEVELATGVCEGRITREARGANGFAYDPVFAPLGFERTFGELSSEVKARISHRAYALAAMRAILRRGV